jgi:hypothetical protein
MRLLNQDIGRAGYFALHADGRLLATDADVRVKCASHDATGWATATSNPVAGTNASYALPCPPRFAPVPGTDTLTLRFADSEPAEPHASGAIVVTGLAGGVIARRADRAIPADPLARRHLRLAAWYVGADSSEKKRPALYRQRLRDDGMIETQEIMPGIEDFQIRFGIDTNGDGNADQQTNPGVSPGAGLAIVTARVQLRVATGLGEQGHVDSGPWLSIDPDRPPFTPRDNRRRISVAQTFRVRNQPGAL